MPLVRPAYGELLPDSGLTVSLLINLAGSLWEQDRAVDSYAYVCTDILPIIARAIPEFRQSERYWKPICNSIVEAAGDSNGFDATGLCYDLERRVSSLIGPFVTVETYPGEPPYGGGPYNTTYPGEPPYGGGTYNTTYPGEPPYGGGPYNTTYPGEPPYGGGPYNTTYPGEPPYGGGPYNTTYPGEPPYGGGNWSYTSEPMVYVDPFVQILMNISQIFGIDINNISTVCAIASDLLEPSPSDLVLDFGSRILSFFLPQASPICQDVDAFLNATLTSFGIDSSSPYYQVIQDAIDIAPRLVGYNSIDAICQQMNQVLQYEGSYGIK